jgi:hypothetical protein
MNGKCSTHGRDEKFVPHCTVSASVSNDPSGIHTGGIFYHLSSSKRFYLTVVDNQVAQKFLASVHRGC